jgi:predicted O-methyltransferase YrrM
VRNVKIHGRILAAAHFKSTQRNMEFSTAGSGKKHFFPSGFPQIPTMIASDPNFPFPLTSRPATDPTPLYRYRDGLYAVDLLSAAIVFLDFFTWLNSHPADQPSICRSLGLAERPVDVMLTLFSANGLVRKEGPIFQLTPLAKDYLVKDSPFFLGPYYAALKDRPVCKDFVEILRTGKPAKWGGLDAEKDWAQAMEEPSFAATFTGAMDCRGVYLGQFLAEKLDCREYHKLLDIAGGSGIYACAIAAAHPHMRAAVFDKPPVDQVAARLIAERGCAERVSVLAGDMFVQELPGGFDMHLFSNVLHDWDEPKVLQLLAASFRALPPKGMVVIHDAHLNREKTGPLEIAEYSTLLMHATEGRCYSVSEMERYLAQAGFKDPNYFPTAAYRSVITARKPA